VLTAICLFSRPVSRESCKRSRAGEICPAPRKRICPGVLRFVQNLSSTKFRNKNRSCLSRLSEGKQSYSGLAWLTWVPEVEGMESFSPGLFPTTFNLTLHYTVEEAPMPVSTTPNLNSSVALTDGVTWILFQLVIVRMNVCSSALFWYLSGLFRKSRDIEELEPSSLKQSGWEWSWSGPCCHSIS